MAGEHKSPSAKPQTAVAQQTAKQSPSQGTRHGNRLAAPAGCLAARRGRPHVVDRGGGGCVAAHHRPARGAADAGHPVAVRRPAPGQVDRGRWRPVRAGGGPGGPQVVGGLAAQVRCSEKSWRRRVRSSPIMAWKAATWIPAWPARSGAPKAADKLWTKGCAPLWSRASAPILAACAYTQTARPTN